jgi:cation-transporting P-type ATPase F
MNSKQDKNSASVREIYAGFRHYQVINSNDSSEGYILEVSPQESKCWLLDDIKLYSHTALRECLIAGIFCNNSQWKEQQGQWILVGNSIDNALIAVASKARLNLSNLEKLMPKLDIVSFPEKFQYMATLHQNIDGKTIYLKSFLERVLPCVEQMIDSTGDLVSLESQMIKLEAKSMTQEGLEVFAFAKKQVSTEKTSLKHNDLKSGFIFLGLQGLSRSHLLQNSHSS